jgi:hypothetical protein
MTAKGQAQRFLEAMEPAGPIQDAPQGWKHTPFSAALLDKRPYAGTFPDDISDGPQPTPKCAELFSGLKEAGWGYLRQLKSSECLPEDTPDHSIRLGIALLMKQSLTTFYHILKTRENCIRIHQMYGEGVEGNITLGFPERKAERITVAKMILRLSQLAEDEDGESVTDFVMSIVHMIREGGRWLELIDAVGAPEILLIGRGHGDKYGENDAVDHRNAPPSAAILEENFKKDYRLVDIAQTTRDGDDDAFRKMKELHLMPDLRLGETCHRLSGLYQLIDRLGGIEEGLGLEDEISTTHGEFVKPKTNQKFDLLSSWSCEIEQRIRKVLRKADSGQEDELEHLASRILSLLRPELERRMKESESETGVEEAFSNEVNPEEICQSNTGEQNGEVDEDFCINFLTDDALRMFDLD